MPKFELVCPVDAGGLREENSYLACECGELYPIITGVPVMMPGVTIAPQREKRAPEVLDELVDAFSIDPSLRSEIESVFANKFVFVEDWIQTEADQFLHRVSASHGALRSALQLEPGRVHRDSQVNVDLNVSLTTLFRVSTARPASQLSLNLRVENLGSSTLSSNGELPFVLSYHWHSSSGLISEGHRTPLLDDLPPGRSVSVPIFISTPDERGSYRLQIRALQEGVSWFDRTSIEFEVEIGDGRGTTDDPPWQQTGKQFSYVDDHFEGLRKLKEWGRELFDRPVDIFVELGGNASPMIDYIEAPTKYNVDVDPYGMIIANLIRPRDTEFVIADGMALPMPRRSIDVLVMFATFHHFPDPVGLLSRLSEFVKNDGLICLICEPIGHVHRDSMPAEYLDEIRKGVNEQSFALWEYEQMFEAAQLDVAGAQIDIGSAKFALRPRADRG